MWLRGVEEGADRRITKVRHTGDGQDGQVGKGGKVRAGRLGKAGRRINGFRVGRSVVFDSTQNLLGRCG